MQRNPPLEGFGTKLAIAQSPQLHTISLLMIMALAFSLYFHHEDTKDANTARLDKIIDMLFEIARSENVDTVSLSLTGGPAIHIENSEGGLEYFDDTVQDWVAFRDTDEPYEEFDAIMPAGLNQPLNIIVNYRDVAMNSYEFNGLSFSIGVSSVVLRHGGAGGSVGEAGATTLEVYMQISPSGRPGELGKLQLIYRDGEVSGSLQLGSPNSTISSDELEILSEFIGSQLGIPTFGHNEAVQLSDDLADVIGTPTLPYIPERSLPAEVRT